MFHTYKWFHYIYGDMGLLLLDILVSFGTFLQFTVKGLTLVKGFKFNSITYVMRNKNMSTQMTVTAILEVDDVH